jgi:hypothetical protein
MYLISISSPRLVGHTANPPPLPDAGLALYVLITIAEEDSTPSKDSLIKWLSPPRSQELKTRPSVSTSAEDQTESSLISAAGEEQLPTNRCPSTLTGYMHLHPLQAMQLPGLRIPTRTCSLEDRTERSLSLISLSLPLSETRLE